MLYTRTRTTLAHRSGRREFIILYALAATLGLLLTPKLAFTFSWGRVADIGWVNLNSLGGLLLGATQGLLQYTILRSRYRISCLWIPVTALAWAIALGWNWQSLGPGADCLQDLASPIGLALSGLCQCLLLPKTLCNRWLKVVLGQLLWVGLVQIATWSLLFITAVVAIATLGKATAILSVLQVGAIGLYHSQLLAHSLIPAIGLAKLGRAG